MQDKPNSALREWLGSGSINIFGLPFAGKDSQGSQLSKLFDAPMIGGGDILRNSTIPDHVRKIMHDGELIPTEDYMQIVMPYLSQKELEGKPLILSSVGRWKGEETGVIQALAKADHPLRAVIYLNLDERHVWRRWEHSSSYEARGKRHDDQADALEVRLDEFRVKTIPVINFYRDIKLLIEIDASRSVEEVSRDILDQLAKRL